MRIQSSSSTARAQTGLPDGAPTPQALSTIISRSRRDFLRDASRLALGSMLLRSNAFAGTAAGSNRKKVVVITFGGGARDQETFAPEGQENIPHLMREL